MPGDRRDPLTPARGAGRHAPRGRTPLGRLLLLTAPLLAVLGCEGRFVSGAEEHAREAHAERRWHDALALWDEAVADRPADRRLRLARLTTLARLDPDAALDEFVDLAEDAPVGVHAYESLARELYSAEAYGLAKDLAGVGRALFPDEPVFDRIVERARRWSPDTPNRLAFRLDPFVPADPWPE